MPFKLTDIHRMLAYNSVTHDRPSSDRNVGGGLELELFGSAFFEHEKDKVTLLTTERLALLTSTISQTIKCSTPAA